PDRTGLGFQPHHRRRDDGYGRNCVTVMSRDLTLCDDQGPAGFDHTPLGNEMVALCRRHYRGPVPGRSCVGDGVPWAPHRPLCLEQKCQARPPEGGEAYAALADRPEADAIICWRAAGSAVNWPTIAAEAENASQHACVRVSYSTRFAVSQWRAFIDPPQPGG
ncbi:MAG: hypothetical protein HC788_12390, partial [Sphingopyxis sp.]|nr:hypothetical protein [Sphingopyxis sp.]